jgi:hypothetical protein
MKGREKKRKEQEKGKNIDENLLFITYSIVLMRLAYDKRPLIHNLLRKSVAPVSWGFRCMVRPVERWGNIYTR